MKIIIEVDGDLEEAKEYLDAFNLDLSLVNSIKFVNCGD
jgi:hypothetical protein